ncbi:hypothetical protein CsSME_00044225 [Camellia sinensis var. sinensis]
MCVWNAQANNGWRGVRVSRVFSLFYSPICREREAVLYVCMVCVFVYGRERDHHVSSPFTGCSTLHRFRNRIYVSERERNHGLGCWIGFRFGLRRSWRENEAAEVNEAVGDGGSVVELQRWWLGYGVAGGAVGSDQSWLEAVVVARQCSVTAGSSGGSSAVLSHGWLEAVMVARS